MAIARFSIHRVVSVEIQDAQIAKGSRGKTLFIHVIEKTIWNKMQMAEYYPAVYEEARRNWPSESEHGRRKLCADYFRQFYRRIA